MRLHIGRLITVALLALCEVYGQTPPKSHPTDAISWPWGFRVKLNAKSEVIPNGIPG